MQRRCRSCGDDFDPHSPRKKAAGGKIDECPDCAVELAVKYVGAASNDGKVAGIEVIAAATPEERDAYMRWRHLQAGMHKGKSCPLTSAKAPPAARVKLVATFGGNPNHKGKA